MKEPLSLCFDNTEQAFAYKSDAALNKSCQLFSMMQSGLLVKIGSFLAPLAFKLHLPIKGLIRQTIFEQFCGGETLQEAARTAAALHTFSVQCALDYGVEAAEGEKNYDRAVEEFKKAIVYAGSQEDIPMISLKITAFARFQLLEKRHAGKPLTGPEQMEWQRVFDRVDAVCRTAYDHHIGVLVDAEESWIQGPVDALVQHMMQQYNQQQVTVYNTFQMYQHQRLMALQQQWAQSRKNNYLLGAKLVRGAYMDKERRRAEERGYPSPIQPDKAATDHDFNTAVRWCLEHIDTIALFIGTHNEESCMLAASYLHDHQLPHNHPHVHFSQLYGMSDNITFNLSRAGFRASKYMPYGPIEEVLPYLIRRSKENSSISGQTGRELLLLKREQRRRRNSRKHPSSA